MLPPVITETIERHWDGELLPEPIVRTLIPFPGYDGARSVPVSFVYRDRRDDYAEGKRITAFGTRYQRTRTADWAFWQSGAIVTRDATIADMAERA